MCQVQTLCISWNFHTVTIAFLKTWSFGYGFTLSLPSKLLCIYQPQKRKEKLVELKLKKKEKPLPFIPLVMFTGPLLHPVLPNHLTSVFLALIPVCYTRPTLTGVHTVHHWLVLPVREYMGLFHSEFGRPHSILYRPRTPSFLSFSFFIYSWITFCFVHVTCFHYLSIRWWTCRSGPFSNYYK